MEIRRVCKEFKLTTVYVTHDQKEALSISDRMAILDGGRILQVGTPQEIYRRPAKRTGRGFHRRDELHRRQACLGSGGRRVATAVGPLEGVLGDPSAPAGPGRGGHRLGPARMLDDLARATRPERVRGRIGESIYLGETPSTISCRGDDAEDPRAQSPVRRPPGAGDLLRGVRPEDVVVLTGLRAPRC
jgi:iron(III) transport system ATP-binding protein